MNRSAPVAIAELENQLALAKIMARRFWSVLRTRVDVAAVALFLDELDGEARRVVDVAFDAAEIVWERHRVLVEPCRVILEGGSPHISLHAGPTQPEMFVARHPNGESRNVTRAQLLMMAGIDVEGDAA